MTDPEVNIRALDAAYKPFPTFEEWASRTTVDTVRWDRYYASLNERAKTSPEALRRAREIAKRAAALDTGAIEGLYEVDRGFTFTVALETAAWEAALAQKGEQVRPLFEAQLRAYDYVLDLATEAQPLAEAAIRKLHEVVCDAQATYRVMTAIGPQEQPLPKGQYKVLPNHVRTRKGTEHSYAPVDVTSAEMARLLGELRNQAFLAAHPVQQAAYAHYGLVVIHPFADGNGRVARAVASAYTYRAISMPILILSEQKGAYLDALEAADSGQYQTFVNFVLARSLDTIQLVADSLGPAHLQNADQTIARINSLYVTKGGYTHEQVDKAAEQLASALASEISKVLAKAAPRVSSNASLARGGGNPGPPDQRHRNPFNGDLRLDITASTSAPLQAGVRRIYHAWVPKDATGDDDVLLVGPFPDPTGKRVETISARMEQLVPRVEGLIQVRLGIIGNRIAEEMLADLEESAERVLKTK